MTSKDKMDMRSWKKVLVQWVTECGFTERNFFNLEQSNIDAFFREFAQQHKLAAVQAPTQTLLEFLQQHYPEFHPHLDDENALSSGDYIYVYSLLLHFCCVRHPEAYFHEICQKLSQPSQQYIAGFFKELIDCTDCDKEQLRRAIADVTAANASTSPQLDGGGGGGNSNNNSSGSSSATALQGNNNNLTDSSNNGGECHSGGGGGGQTSHFGVLSSPSCYPRLEAGVSPFKTPSRHGIAPLRISPSTPKSFLLEERTRELYHLRAQLETERYEKGMLEVQIKQSDDKIAKLNQNHRLLKQQIQELKHAILIKNAESSPTNREGDGDKQLKRRLCKDIAHKEQEIMRLNEMVSVLQEEKSMTNEKLVYAEEQILLCMGRIKEMDHKVDEMTLELEQKNEAIRYLEENKLELENFIQEVRADSANSRIDLNTSVDCMNMSYSRATNSSSSLGSPENLGCSVVDIKFQEKLYENTQLREQLTVMRLNNSRLARQMQQCTLKMAQEFELSSESDGTPKAVPLEAAASKAIDVSGDGIVDVTEYFNMYLDCTEKMSKCYRNEKNNANCLKADVEFAKQEALDLHKRLEQFERDVQMLQAELSEAKKSNEALIQENTNLSVKFESAVGETTALRKQQAVLVEKLDSLASDYDGQLERQQTQEEQHKAFTARLQELLDASNAQNATAHQMNGQLNSDLLALQASATIQTTELTKLRLQLSEQQTDSEKQQVQFQQLSEQCQQLQNENEQLKRQVDESQTQTTHINRQLQEKQEALNQLQSELGVIRSANTEMEERMNSLLNNCEVERSKSDASLRTHDDRLREAVEEKELSIVALKAAELKLQQQEEKLKAAQESIAVIRLLFVSPRPPAEGSEMASNGDLDQDNSNIVLSELTERIKDLLEQHADAKSKIACLELKAQESAARQRDADERLGELTRELHSAQQAQANREQELCGEAADVAEAQQRLETELLSAKERCSSKESELLIVIGEHNAVKQRLNEATGQIDLLQTENDRLQSSYTEKVIKLEEKIDTFVSANVQLAAELSSLSNTPTKTNTPTTKLRTPTKRSTPNYHRQASRRTSPTARIGQGDCGLQASEMRLLATSQRLEEAVAQSMQTMYDLRSMYETQTQRLQRVETKVTILEQLRSEQDTTNEQLQQSLVSVGEERTKLLEDANKLTAQMQSEHEEHTNLLHQLDQTAAQLKLALLEKESEAQQMRERAEQIDEANTQLQADVAAKGAELRLAIDESEHERHEWQMKLSEMTLKMTQISIESQAHETALLELVATLENNANFASEAQLATDQDMPDVFNAATEVPSTPGLVQLKKQLNRLVWLATQVEQKRAELSERVDTLSVENVQWKKEMKQYKADVTKLQDVLAGEARSLDNHLRSEVERLHSDLTNADCINEQLSEENMTIRSKLTKCEERMRLDIANATKLRQQAEKKAIQIENQLQDTRGVLSIAEERLLTNEERIFKAESKAAIAEKQLDNLQNDHSELQEKYRLQQAAHQTLEVDMEKQRRELSAVRDQLSQLEAAYKQAQEQLSTATSKLDKSIAQQLTAETRRDATVSSLQQLQRDNEFQLTQLTGSKRDVNRLRGDVDSLKLEKQQLMEELKENRRELQRANDNISELIQQVGSARIEKENLVEETQLLRKQLDETGRTQSTSESRIKTIVERSQSLERQLLTSENEAKSLRSQVEKHETTAEKISAENERLRVSQENSTKRIEKLALKLGDLQARAAKLESDNEKLSALADANKTTVEALQRERDTLQVEAKSLKERLAQADRMQDTLTTRTQTLELANGRLEALKEKLEASEIESKTKLSKLEKMRESQEEKLRKLNNALDQSESATVRLNLEIGALNSQLREIRTTTSAERLSQVEQIKHDRDEAQSLAEQREREVELYREQNATLGEQLEKARLALSIAEESAATSHKELKAVQEELEQISAELAAQKSDMASRLAEQASQLSAQKTEYEQCLASRESELKQLQAEVNSLREVQSRLNADEASLSMATATQLAAVRTRLQVAEEMLSKEQVATTQLRVDNEILQAKYRGSKQKLLDETAACEERIKENRLEMEGKLEKMKNKMKSLYADEVAKTKSKQERDTVKFKSELETLRAQNTKYEAHTRKLSSQIVRLNDQLLEQRKQNALLTTNVKRLEDQQQPSSSSSTFFKRPPSAVQMSALATAAPASNNLPSNMAMEDEEGEIFNNTYLTDLKMGRMPEHLLRDVCAEELQYRNSLQPPHLKSSYAVAYTDHGLNEEELKDGAICLDDSMSALLNTTNGGGGGRHSHGGGVGGLRKKLAGATHYKRPGPPTPSKNGGRLSFGGSEPPREILRETYDTRNGGSSSAGATAHSTSVSSAKTPSRFGHFVSRFSMGNVKDELTALKRPPLLPDGENPLEEANRLRAVQHKNIAILKDPRIGAAICTSTPRKPSARFGPRRLRSNFLMSSPSTSATPSPLAAAAAAHEPTKDARQVSAADGGAGCLAVPDVSAIETPTLRQRASMLPRNITGALLRHDRRHSRRSSVLLGSRVQARSRHHHHQHHQQQQHNTPTTASSGGTAGREKRGRRRLRRDRGMRLSLHLHGNIFAKQPRTPVSGSGSTMRRDHNRRKAHRKRFELFNQQRQLPTTPISAGAAIEEVTQNDHQELIVDYKNNNNNNYATCNQNATVVISKQVLAAAAATMESVLVGDSNDGLENDSSISWEDEEDSITTTSDSSSAYDVVPSDEEELTANDLVEIKQEECEPTQRRTDKVKLITSGELMAFDRQQQMALQQTFANPANRSNDDFRTQDGDLRHFERLLGETVSAAPFDVKRITFECPELAVKGPDGEVVQPVMALLSIASSSGGGEAITSFSHSQSDIDLNAGRSLTRFSGTPSARSTSTGSASTNSPSLSAIGRYCGAAVACSTVLTATTPPWAAASSGLVLRTSSSPSASLADATGQSTGLQLSRTVYGGSIICSRGRLPHVDLTSVAPLVRKSSIYVKRSDRADQDIILLTNQTITVVDLARMWRQMDVVARLFVAVALCAPAAVLAIVCFAVLFGF